ncbi:hypothetical protein TELCIR_05151 [Teladorsagia circumcincta]|uniref:Uncharacterized protein n=1 Tax=Teladorsagia circumcincta TaxID=45464 RepID=A0A2G9URN9_TELCI|nr:hypothetical protein TELCIR_05151 [Teladorsagia circumcincta]
MFMNSLSPACVKRQTKAMRRKTRQKRRNSAIAILDFYETILLMKIPNPKAKKASRK